MRIQETRMMQNINPQNKVAEKNDGDFNKSLERQRGSKIKDQLQSLLERIDVQGKRLANKMDLSELKEYKKLITEFLNLAVNNSHKFSREHYLDNRGRHRVYAIVKKVDDELESLTKEVLKNEKGNINALGKIDGIRGMLLDLIA